MSQEVGSNQDPAQGETQDHANGGANEGATNYEAEIKRLTAMNERLLDESKKYKTRFDKVQSAQNELEALRAEKLEREGSMEEKVNFYKQRYDSLAESHTDLKSQLVMNKLESRFKRIAPDCKKVDLVINNPVYAEQIKAALDVENMDVDSEILKSIYAADRDENPFLYGGEKVPKMVGGVATADTKKSEVNVNEMSPDEYKAYVLNN